MSNTTQAIPQAGSPDANGATRRQALLGGGSAVAAAIAAATLVDSARAQAVSSPSAAAVTQFVEVGGRKLAYRSVGQGKPLVLFHRFRGVLGLWDPAFIDALAAEGFQVITFDYSGIGLSTGQPSYNPGTMVKDAKDLIDALGLKDVAIGGWSIGGIVAQIYLAMFGAGVSHVVLLATTPPGKLVKGGEQLFYDAAAVPGLGLDNFTTIFFEPKDEASRAASKRSFDRIMSQKVPRSPDVPADWAMAQIGNTPRNPVFPVEEVLQVLKSTNVPILHIGADHDIVFPIENWYALNGQLPTTRLITYPKTGHGPQHQFPEEAARHIASFIRTTRKV